MLWETALDLKKKDDTSMIVKNDPSDPITELFSCANLIWGPNINQEQDVRADWDFFEFVAHSLVFPLTTAPPAVK